MSQPRVMGHVMGWVHGGKAKSRRHHLKTSYGLTTGQVEVMASNQHGRCAICGTIPPALVVDHDHETKRVRALLCDPCNRGLGNFRDDRERLSRAIAYLETHARPVR